MFNTDGDWDTPNAFEAGIDSGDMVNPGYSSVLVGGPDIVALGVDGLDDDCDVFDGLCSMGSAPGTSMGGSNGEMDYAQAWTDVNTLVSGPGESFSAPFSMSTNAYALQVLGRRHLQRHLRLIAARAVSRRARRVGPRVRPVVARRPAARAAADRSAGVRAVVVAALAEEDGVVVERLPGAEEGHRALLRRVVVLGGQGPELAEDGVHRVLLSKSFEGFPPPRDVRRKHNGSTQQLGTPSKSQPPGSWPRAGRGRSVMGHNAAREAELRSVGASTS